MPVLGTASLHKGFAQILFHPDAHSGVFESHPRILTDGYTFVYPGGLGVVEPLRLSLGKGARRETHDGSRVSGLVPLLSRWHCAARTSAHRSVPLSLLLSLCGQGCGNRSYRSGTGMAAALDCSRSLFGHFRAMLRLLVDRRGTTRGVGVRFGLGSESQGAEERLQFAQGLSMACAHSGAMCVNS